MAGLLDPEDEAYLASLQRRQAPAARPIRARNLDGLLAPDAGPSGVAPWSGLPPTPGYTEARVAAPLRADDLQGFLGQTRDVLRGTPGASGYEPNRVTQLVADSAAGPAGTVGGARGIRAFHGSPHDFDRFRMDRIGTGEGAQAYGHGLYFAEKEGLARGYRDALSQPLVALDGQPITSQTGNWSDALADLWRQGRINPQEEEALSYLVGAPTLDGVIANLRAQSLQPWRGSASAQELSQRAEVLEAMRSRLEITPQGRMYEVNLNVDPNRLLDWDAPLSQQPQAVRDALGRLVDPAWTAGEYGARMQGGPLYRTVAQTPEAQTQALRDAGVQGIRYLDQGSRGAGEGSRNYVMFDDALIEILRKYGLVPGMVGGGGTAGLLGGAEGTSEQ